MGVLVFNQSIQSRYGDAPISLDACKREPVSFERTGVRRLQGLEAIGEYGGLDTLDFIAARIVKAA